MKRDYKEALKLADPTRKLFEMFGQYPLIAIKKEITTGSADETVLSRVPFDLEIVDVIIQPRGASTNGTVTINDGTNDITDAITCAVDKTIGRAGTINDAYSSLDAGDEIHAECAGDTVANTKCLVTILAIPA